MAARDAPRFVGGFRGFAVLRRSRHADDAVVMGRAARPICQNLPDSGAESDGAGDPGGSVTLYFALKFLHVIGATVLLGTGAGIAFFMLMAHFGGDPAVIAGTARIVVIADFVFTATAVVAQP